MFRYDFHIIDNEFGCEYDYEAYFFNHDEAYKFIDENEKAGNVVVILNAQIFMDERTPIDEVPKDHF
jgi:hypothetical protein